jgi:hypothetical protein
MLEGCMATLAGLALGGVAAGFIFLSWFVLLPAILHTSSAGYAWADGLATAALYTAVVAPLGSVAAYLWLLTRAKRR